MLNVPYIPVKELEDGENNALFCGEKLELAIACEKMCDTDSEVSTAAGFTSGSNRSGDDSASELFRMSDDEGQENVGQPPTPPVPDNKIAPPPPPPHAAPPPNPNEAIILNGSIPIEHYYTHLPRRDDCPTCMQAKQRRARAARIPEADRQFATKWGERISFDHSIIGHGKGIDGNKVALNVCDEATDMWYYYPAKTKSASEVEDALRHISLAAESAKSRNYIPTTRLSTKSLRRGSGSMKERVCHVDRRPTRDRNADRKPTPTWWRAPCTKPPYPYNYGLSPGNMYVMHAISGEWTRIAHTPRSRARYPT